MNWHDTRARKNRKSMGVSEGTISACGGIVEGIGPYQISSRKPPDLSVGMNVRQIELVENKKRFKNS